MHARIYTLEGMLFSLFLLRLAGTLSRTPSKRSCPVPGSSAGRAAEAWDIYGNVRLDGPRLKGPEGGRMRRVMMLIQISTAHPKTGAK